MVEVERIEEKIIELHERVKKLKEENEELCKKIEIIDIIVFLRNLDFRRLRDLKISIIKTSSPRCENILEKITIQMEAIEDHCERLRNKQSTIKEKLERNKIEINKAKKEEEYLQKTCPETVFRCCRY